MGILAQNFTFKIPVYLNMPEEVCAEPTKDGNPNNKLKSLSVSGHSISPAFNRDTTSYSLSVGESVSSISVSATKYASTTTLTGTGSRSLQYGNNKIDVIATAQNGDERIYTINVYREPGDNCISHTDANGTWETDGTYHWHTCSCGEIFDKTTHSDANNIWETDGLNHWHTCTCGVILDKTVHTDEDGKWEYDNNSHWHTCMCGVTFDSCSHSGGIATCSELKLCSDCGISYGSLDSDNHGETEIRDAWDPTDTEEGYTGDMYCVDCNTLIKEGSIIPPTGVYLELIDNSSYYIENGYLFGVKDYTSVDTLKASFKKSDKVFVSDDGSLISGSSLVCTGNLIYTLGADGKVLDSLTLVILGDVTGDGKIGASDYMKIKKAIANSSLISGAFVEAADVNKDGKIGAADYMMVKKYIAGAFNMFG